METSITLKVRITAFLMSLLLFCLSSCAQKQAISVKKAMTTYNHCSAHNDCVAIKYNCKFSVAIDQKNIADLINMNEKINDTDSYSE